jgi:hypothetical protein
MKWLHLASLGCLSTLSGAHTASCVQDPRSSLAHWIATGAYLVLTAIQAITLVLVLRHHESANSAPPPVI